MYIDLSVLADQTIDLTFLLGKLQKDGYSAFALDYQFRDEGIFKANNQELPAIQGVNLYKRATYVLENMGSLHLLNQQPVPYQIVAVKPLNQKMFHSLCIDYDFYDVITFNCGEKMPFMMKRNPVYEAIRKGKFFEISYDSMFDADKRVICMTNISNIIKATGGKNLIISSHCSNHATHRTPFDITALMVSLGMSKNKALCCLKENMMEVIRSSQHRKYLKGAIKQIPIQIGLKLGKKILKHRNKLKQLKSKMQKKEEQKMKQ